MVVDTVSADCRIPGILRILQISSRLTSPLRANRKAPTPTLDYPRQFTKQFTKQITKQFTYTPKFPLSNYPHPPPHVPHPRHPRACLWAGPQSHGVGGWGYGKVEIRGICKLFCKLLCTLPRVGVGPFLFPSNRCKDSLKSRLCDPALTIYDRILTKCDQPD